ncbi:MAG: preprotein translocase subunit SecE [Bacilli bacterium]|jgi:preprotein translocase subunit SecE|nr:preprotein translocase subunit SecE [Mycoplasmatota bacterium]MDD6264418.1 preprotein translocase subunit SecE [bacterium]MDY2697176.1 preprotein translocase subunit SecE [Bacilli bacterium]MDD6941155.1 preprotein translocase subunit SecE [bacterium]MDY5992946.1 preprotein translocase subunit SecE [Bacilli bacterium]
MATEKTKKSTENKNKKEIKKDTKKSNKSSESKKSAWVRFRIFCHGVKSEISKVHWPSKEDMVRYSIATIVFIIFCSLFFYLIEVIFALIQSLI